MSIPMRPTGASPRTPMAGTMGTTGASHRTPMAGTNGGTAGGDPRTPHGWSGAGGGNTRANVAGWGNARANVAGGGQNGAAWPERGGVAKTGPRGQNANMETDGWDDATRGHFIGLHGTGGAGKTTLAAQLPGKTLFIDLEGSLKIVKPKLAAMGLLASVTPKFLRFDAKAPAAAWNDLLAFLGSGAAAGFDNVAIDSFTRAQEWAAQNCIESIPGDSATIRKSLEQWMYGKGAQLVYDKFAPIYPLIFDLLEQGKNVIALAHTEPTRFTNADGQDYWQNQPRLVQGDKGKAPGRADFLEKTDHLLYLAADVSVEKGKATGGMSRTLYTGGLATMMAKSRTVQGCAFAVPNWTEENPQFFDWGQILG